MKLAIFPCLMLLFVGIAIIGLFYYQFLLNHPEATNTLTALKLKNYG